MYLLSCVTLSSVKLVPEWFTVFMEGSFGSLSVNCQCTSSRVIPLQEILTCRFPNPPGSNRCWMNATLQMLLGMEPFMEELECFCLRCDQNNRCAVLHSFFEVMKYRRWRRRLSLHSALRWVWSQNSGTSIWSSRLCRWRTSNQVTLAPTTRWHLHQQPKWFLYDGHKVTCHVNPYFP